MQQPVRAGGGLSRALEEYAEEQASGGEQSAGGSILRAMRVGLRVCHCTLFTRLKRAENVRRALWCAGRCSSHTHGEHVLYVQMRACTLEARARERKETPARPQETPAELVGACEGRAELATLALVLFRFARVVILRSKGFLINALK